LQDSPSHIQAKQTPVPDEWSQSEDGQRIAGIDGRWDTMEQMERGSTAAFFAFVLDVISNQERIVKELERNRRIDCVRNGGAEDAGSRNAEARTK
jgi:hypothetical protein